jgi:hypothetical protein
MTTVYSKITTGTVLTIRNSGGTAAITFASLANGNGTSAGARQAMTLDFGPNWAQRWRMEADQEFATAPTAGNAVNYFASWSNTSGAGQANTTGSDAAYTGYSNNIDASVRQLELLGAFIVTAQATSTVQRGLIGIIFPKARYMNLVVDNRSGVAFHNTDTNQVVRFTPLEELVQDSI